MFFNYLGYNFADGSGILWEFFKNKKSSWIQITNSSFERSSYRDTFWFCNPYLPTTFKRHRVTSTHACKGPSGSGLWMSWFFCIPYDLDYRCHITGCLILKQVKINHSEGINIFWIMVQTGFMRFGYLRFINQFSKKQYLLASTVNSLRQKMCNLGSLISIWDTL